MTLAGCLAVFNCALIAAMDRSLLDFSSLYTSGGMIVEGHRALLFDNVAQAEFQHRVLGMHTMLPMYHLAYESLLFVPLALLPFRVALWFWRILSLAMLVVSTRQLADAFNIVRSHALWLALAFTPVAVAIAQGQDSILLLLLLSSSLVCMNKGRERSAGLFIALALFKPHLILPIAALLVWRRGQGFLQGFLGGLAAVLFVNTCTTGIGGWPQMADSWRADLSNAGLQISGNARNMPNFRGVLCTMGLSGHAVTVFSAALSILLILLVAWRLRMRRSPEILFPALIAMALPIGAHLYAHDLTLLFIPVLALLVMERNSMTLGAGAAYCLLLFVILGHVAFFCFVILWILALTLKAAGAEPPPPIAA
jgi:hypothetical protein